MRALLIVLDSVGCGHAPDAAAFGDEGADTLGHIYASTPGFTLPTLEALGLAAILHGERADCAPWDRRPGCRGGTGVPACPELPGSESRSGAGGTPAPLRQARTPVPPCASWGRMSERSVGKDTTTGHWEIAGAILPEPFPVFERFPDVLVRAIEREGGVTFIGNFPRSGTAVLDELGPEHLRTGHPILYTSADSVLQIAAHESIFPREKLHALCAIARRHCDEYRIGRVIARPFEGTPGNFHRTSGRHDYAMQPPRTILNALADAGHTVHGIGKISDIFAGSGITASTPTATNAEGMSAIEQLWPAFDGLLFANLVDFDMLYGHRRDVPGYARALREFDDWLATFLKKTAPTDLIILTADHGNDPTWRGTDHTREQVPLIVLHGGKAHPLGTRDTFADIAATLAQAFALEAWPVGSSFLP